MNALAFAMKMEHDGEQYYRELAEKSTEPGIVAIFNLLADAEVQHQKVLAQLQAQSDTLLPDSTVLQDAKNLFVQMKQRAKPFTFHISQIDLYKKAQAIEQRSRDFYTNAAETATEEAEKQLLLRIAEEENQHCFLLDNLIDFVSRPQTWLENAEWYHLDEY